MRTLAFVLALLAPLVLAAETAPPEPTPADILATLERVAAWQLAHPNARAETAPPKKNGQPHEEPEATGWIPMPFYLGLLELDAISPDNRWRSAVRDIGAAHDWKPGTERNNLYYADNHGVFQAYLGLHRLERRAEIIANARATYDRILAEPRTEPIDFAAGGPRFQDRWSWCDALFMSPAALVELSELTGDRRYLEFANHEWWATTDALFSPEHGLYYRDSRFLSQKAPNGAPIFWSRGNGWVVAAHCRMLDRLPADHPDRPRYERNYRALIAALLRAQQPDGFWRVSLLDPEHFPAKESSGTAFHAYALAWGLNRGLLDPATARPALFRSWSALASCVTPDGKFTHAQPIGAAPDVIPENHTEPFATGAFLLAGVELHRLLGGEPARRAFARFVPERSDDFAWENDLVAFRAYGPALRSAPEDSGVDCWLKRTKLPIIDKWYAGHVQGVSYHKDHGEGYDPYHVGASRGCGGTALWRDGQLVTSDTFVSQRVVSSDPRHTVFVLNYTYAASAESGTGILPVFRTDHEQSPANIPSSPAPASAVIDEEKTITVRPGSPFYESVSRFTRNGVPLADLEVALGVTTHDGKAAARLEPKSGWIACWERIDDKGLGTAVLADPATIVSAKLVEPSGKDTGHAVLIVRTDANGVVRHRAGFGWEGSGFVRTADEWHAVLAAESAWHGVSKTKKSQ